MNFPSNLDMDRVLSEALSGIEAATSEWLEVPPTSEEPLIHRLTAQFTKRRRHCDVGVRVPVAMTARIASLHRQGPNTTDAFGSDLAITVEIPAQKYRKTALIQIKVSDNFDTILERGQMNQALADPMTRDRSFILVAIKDRRKMRIRSVVKALESVKPGNESATIDSADWMAVSEWLTKWLSCEVGPISELDAHVSVEKLLQKFIVEPPADWESPWGSAEGIDYIANQLPAKAWLQLIFRQAGEPKPRKNRKSR